MHRLQIEYLPVTSLKPYDRNTRKHTEQNVGYISNSIDEFDFNDPIAIWGKDNIIVEGHGRLMAAKKLGIEEVPVIRLDHLTDEGRRAYAQAHNKTAETSEWDYDLQESEIAELTDFDFESFGFEFIDEEENDRIIDKRAKNILQLGIEQFDGVGKYDIPEIAPIHEDEIPPISEWIGFNYVLTDKEPENKAVHFFIDDYQFERLWKQPEKYMDKLSRYAAVLSPDFSPYADMPLALQIYNHYRKHWIGALMQEHGIRVIPTIRASTDPRSLEWYLEGEPKGGVICISSMWTKNNLFTDADLKMYGDMINELNPEKVYIYGNRVKNLTGNIEYIKSFTEKRWK